MTWKTANCVGSALLVAMVAVCVSPARAADAKDLRVKTKQGKVEGKVDGQTRAFLGIPFAAPPVGPLRWKAPMAPAKWSGVRQATEFGNHCMQPTIYNDMVFRDPGISEDCLTLNVWTPAKDKKAKLPVMVWIYGGGFLAGSTSERRQDGANLAKNGVVVVTMNYRLGIFGFFANEELAKESGKNAAGDYGLLDQTAALAWVQKNIEAFGGDPKNVTLFGESAGSFSVSSQMASPLAKGLFARVIGESGGALYGSTGASYKSLQEVSAKNDEFAKTVLSATTLEQLRAIPAQQLLEAQMKKKESGEPMRFWPDVDGYFLPESVGAIYAAGKQNDVPMLAGWNRDEGGIDPKATVESFKAAVEKLLPDHATELLALNPVTDDASAVRAQADLAGDHFIAYSTWKWLEAQTKTGKQPVYRYRFDLAAPADPNHPGGLAAYHSSEIPYVFGDLDLLSSFGYAWRPEDFQTSATMQRYWTNFAKTGDPNGEGLPKWPVYAASSQWLVMHLGPEPMVEPDKHREQELLLDSVWAK
ncbi:carboxylesterase/lipase family protein [Granulicella arctica]|uniref:Carboxylic ester hydrolase n=1 Tax=Granulicella arctica TaxID=940613 RepID=A0A7Y9PJL5_9BACT|nr:carboxylesterase/lipase family protein [Granulicella arctica]NYF81047.1 para-nitrobenzyl esterase [Granulicella arctica]